jgi:serine/threonine protein kinase
MAWKKTEMRQPQAIGAYDLLAKIGAGGAGTVYKARHRESGQVVAVKIMPPVKAGNGVLLKRFEQEFRAARALDHPNIVRALDFQQVDDIRFLVMEFIEGESLGAKLEREGRMAEAEAIDLIAQVCQGLEYAHNQGIIHRDVKPDNILVTPAGVSKLTDLGLAKERVADLNLTRTGRGLGTPYFMAPEQFRNAKGADCRSDIYSLGATLYQMVTGELPFATSSPLDAWLKKSGNELTPPRRLNPTLSDRMDRAIRRAMSAEPLLRPGSCREFLDELTGQGEFDAVAADEAAAPSDLWFVQYEDQYGQEYPLKGSTDSIRQVLAKGLLRNARKVRARRAGSDSYRILDSYPEFREVLNTSAGEPLAQPSSPGPMPPESADAAAAVKREATAPAHADEEMPCYLTPSSPDRGTWLLLLVLAVVTGLFAGSLLFQAK